jgi:DNA-directed RNA polymerase subunit RPC12/RpoP
MSVLRDMSHVLTSVFGCRHERLSRLFTIHDESYMVCLSCGYRVFYSVDAMRPLSRRELQRRRALHKLESQSMQVSAKTEGGPTLAA